MLGLHLVLVTLPRQLPISIEQDIELAALQTKFSVAFLPYLHLGPPTYHQPQAAEIGFTSKILKLAFYNPSPIGLRDVK